MCAKRCGKLWFLQAPTFRRPVREDQRWRGSDRESDITSSWWKTKKTVGRAENDGKITEGADISYIVMCVWDRWFYPDCLSGHMWNCVTSFNSERPQERFCRLNSWPESSFFTFLLLLKRKVVKKLYAIIWGLKLYHVKFSVTSQTFC